MHAPLPVILLVALLLAAPTPAPGQESPGQESPGQGSTGEEAQEVDLELVLLADASGSIDDAEIRFQRQGYAEAITHPQVLAAIAGGLLGRIAVTYVEWGEASSQEVVVPWTVIDGTASATTFALRLLEAPRMAEGMNAIGSALAIAQALIDANAIKGLRRVIDISADSANSWGGVPIAVGRGLALEAGTTINGLAILCRDLDCGGRPIAYDLEEAFRHLIVGGPGAFVVTVDGRQAFAEAVRRKLILEIAGPVAPSQFAPFQLARSRDAAPTGPTTPARLPGRRP